MQTLHNTRRVVPKPAAVDDHQRDVRRGQFALELDLVTARYRRQYDVIRHDRSEPFERKLQVCPGDVGGQGIRGVAIQQDGYAIIIESPELEYERACVTDSRQQDRLFFVLRLGRDAVDAGIGIRRTRSNYGRYRTTRLLHILGQ